MGRAVLLSLLAILAFWSVSVARAEDAYNYYSWTVTYGTKWVLGPEDQQIILINDQFPGPTLEAVTNDNIIINVVNKLDEPFLLTWNGIKQRKNSWQDGVLGTNCPIPPNSNYTYRFQTKDQIGSYTYFPSTAMHRAAGGFGALNIYARPGIPVPYPKPAGDFTFLIGDWYHGGHQRLQKILDSGKPLPFPDGFLMHSHDRASFTGDQGKTYMLRISNIGLSTSFNFQIQSHKLKVVEVEGSHVLQNIYDSIDVHVGQTVTVLVTLDQPVKDYYIAANTRFTDLVYGATAVVYYSNSEIPVSPPAPDGPGPTNVDWSIDQARSFRKQRYAVNGVSYINSDTPLKLADYFNISGVFSLNSIKSAPSGSGAKLATSVMGASLHEFIEVVFQNNEDTLQSWHLDGYDFWVVGNGIKQRKNSWQDGVLGTNCPIPPNSNYTYKFQTKDQIGSYTYFPSTGMHRAAGGFGALNIYARSVIPVPYPKPAGDFTLLIGDWYHGGHQRVQQILDSGKPLPFPDGFLIHSHDGPTFTGDQGKTYMLRISNIGLSTSFNFRIQGHKLKLVEVEGSHVLQNMYDSLDVHVGQSVTVLVTLDQPVRDYYIIASTRFTDLVYGATAVVHYSNSEIPVSAPAPDGPTTEVQWSIDQARSFRYIT
ncbi:UNVERIFIED_CONTAM: L-ascorbate oxidase [Sesamum latifolium]|uniref:L-ascorbate oxidase n=1 Tax=Sesamum latifolium TaxID=2727402 RepID=A0AAW2XDR6_9LAMI